MIYSKKENEMNKPFKLGDTLSERNIHEQLADAQATITALEAENKALREQVEELDGFRVMVMGAVSWADEYGNGDISTKVLKKFASITKQEQE